MITDMVASLADAIPDLSALRKIGFRRTERSGVGLAATITEYAVFCDVEAGFAGGVSGSVVHIHCDRGQRLAAEQVRWLLHAAGTGSAGSCHYVISADGYSDDFAESFEAVAPPGAVISLVDRSVMADRNADRQVIERLAVAEAVLMGRSPAEVLSWDIADPIDFEDVAVAFARVLHQVCEAAVDFSGPIDLAEGAEEVWKDMAEAVVSGDQRLVALMALNVASGALRGAVLYFAGEEAAERIGVRMGQLLAEVRQVFRSVPEA